MNNDTVTVVTTETWGSRLSHSFKGILFGVLLAIGAVVVLFWNEGRAVDRAKALETGAGVVVSVDSTKVVPANEGKLVHVNALLATSETLADVDFGIRQTVVIKLQRKVEMFQWIEERRSESKEKLGGSKETVTTYSYKKDWAEQLQSSSGFHKPDEHRNPPAMPYEKASYLANDVRVGAFRLNSDQIAALHGEEDLDLGQQTVPPMIGGKRAHRQGNTIFLGQSPADPQVGDLRVRFTVVKPARVSVVAQQCADSFEPYVTSTGKVDLLQQGDIPAQAMFKAAEEDNATMAWLMRLLGIGMMFLALRTILNPLQTLAAVVPLLARIVGFGLGLVSFILALSISLIVIAIAWLWARPLLGGALLVIGVGLPLALKFIRKNTVATIPATASSV